MKHSLQEIAKGLAATFLPATGEAFEESTQVTNAVADARTKCRSALLFALMGVSGSPEAKRALLAKYDTLVTEEFGEDTK